MIVWEGDRKIYLATPPNLPPFADAGLDQLIEAQSVTGATVTLDGSLTSDPENDPLTYEWRSSTGTLIASGVSPILTLPMGTYNITLTATDTSGASGVSTVLVTVQDTIAPTITGTPMDMTVEAADPNGAPVNYTAPTATDSVGPPTPVVSCLPASGATFAPGVTNVTCTATDTAGNSGISLFWVTVEDTIAPTITGTPADMTVQTVLNAGGIVTYTAPTASDSVDLAPVVSCSPASGATFPLGLTIVTCTATDLSANTSSDSFSVNLQLGEIPFCVTDLSSSNVVDIGNGTWRATVTATVKSKDFFGNFYALGNTGISTNWNPTGGGAVSSCTSDINGSCGVFVNQLGDTENSVPLTVLSVTSVLPPAVLSTVNMVYTPFANGCVTEITIDSPIAVPVTECSDGIDNDLNGLIDMADTAGCTSPADNTESSTGAGFTVDGFGLQVEGDKWTATATITGEPSSPVTYSFAGFENMFATLDGAGKLTVQSETIEDPAMTSIIFIATDGTSSATATIERGY